MAKKKKSSKKKEVCEIFEVERKGKEKEIEKCGKIEEKHANKKELERNQKILRNTFLILAGIVVVLLVAYFSFRSLSHFEYDGMKFDVQKAGDVLFYHTSFNIREGSNHIRTHNVWIRTNPKKLDKEVPFEGDLQVMEMTIMNISQDFVCDGDGAISVANLNQVIGQGLGGTVGKDPEASCDEKGRYGYLYLLEGNETRIEQYGPACYKLYISDCEILKVTERFILEILKTVN